VTGARSSDPQWEESLVHLAPVHRFTRCLVVFDGDHGFWREERALERGADGLVAVGVGASALSALSARAGCFPRCVGSAHNLNFWEPNDVATHKLPVAFCCKPPE
jgi:hypothetical protein